LAALDSEAAKKIFADAENKYKLLEEKLKTGGSIPYIPKLDSLATSLKFLQKNPQLLEKGKVSYGVLFYKQGSPPGQFPPLKFINKD
jgi:hypothetical protein